MTAQPTTTPPSKALPPLTCAAAKDISPEGKRLCAIDARARRDRGKPKIDRATAEYERSLAQVGVHIGNLIDSFPPDERLGNEELISLLHAYSQVLKPWAAKVSRRMIEEVNARDVETWRALAKSLSRPVAREIQRTDVGLTMARLAAEQTELIASLPIDAAQRVQRLTVKGLIEGEQLARLAREIARSGEVSEAHARLIARTETARTASNLTQARALAAGFPRYRWRTARDKLVRQGHRDMEGKICEWANPPEVNEGGRIMNLHPGTIWNCRCHAQVLIEE